MNFRSLTDWEIELVTRGLQLLQVESSSARLRQGAKNMLDQNMPENFLWRSNG